tara:strand:- start:596 stop:910 length:315 start_codon:yes stop_codon:yes gene_type:complete
MDNLMDAESQPTDDEVTTTKENPGHANPNSVLLTLSWGFFGVGAYLLYWAISGWYGESRADDAKLAFAILLGVLVFPLGLFVRRWAHREFAKALGSTLTPGSPW